MGKKGKFLYFTQVYKFKLIVFKEKTLLGDTKKHPFSLQSSNEPYLVTKISSKTFLLYVESSAVIITKTSEFLF